MQITPTEIPGVMLVDTAAQSDERGGFGRTYDEAAFAAAGLPTRWPQCNTSWNTKRGTLRGLHYQAAPRPDSKLVRCTAGRIFDVAVDLRRESRTFRRWVGVELSAARRNAIYIPAGCAHGFLTLEDDSEVFYMMAEVYVPELGRGARWNDPAFAVNWPFAPAVITDQDAAWPDFTE
ncbi:MAG: dTDP-4-dehydrorhamnose 3,5-epimerase [Alphaproteobacteria bacterium]|nr:dTDP-4-dehydrorhamnose 3,5-epimerase [Alphaproteobacteria bacterium]